MARIVTKQHAVKIAKKLEAKIRHDKAHDLAEIFEGGKLIAWFGIRRGSEKDQGHDHVQKDLYVNGHQARNLANCPLERKHWISIMKEKGKLDE